MHQYRQQLEDTLNESKDLLQVLKNKIEFLKTKIDIRAEEDIKVKTVVVETYESSIDNSLLILNQEIDLHDTKNRAKALEQIIKSKQQYFNSFIIQLEKDEKEMNEKYSEYIQTCHAIGNTDSEVKDFLGKINFMQAETDLEMKIKVFKELKKIATKVNKPL